MAIKKKKVEILNKRADFDYTLLQRYQAGIELLGTEVKSIRDGKVNLTDAYCYMYKGELFVKNLHISEYKMGINNNHVPRRVRKLLLTSQELRKIESRIKEKGLTVAPIRIYEGERNFLKMEISLAQGKKRFGKKEAKKEKDIKRELQRNLRIK